MWQAEVGTPSSPSFVGMMNFGLKCSHNTRAAAASQKYKMIDLRNWMVFLTPRHILLIYSSSCIIKSIRGKINIFAASNWRSIDHWVRARLVHSITMKLSLSCYKPLQED
jgi:hypothetical protein